jgi:hypothetical protein
MNDVVESIGAMMKKRRPMNDERLILECYEGEKKLFGTVVACDWSATRNLDILRFNNPSRLPL